MGARGERGEVRFAGDGGHVHTAVHRTQAPGWSSQPLGARIAVWPVVTPAILNSEPVPLNAGLFSRNSLMGLVNI